MATEQVATLAIKDAREAELAFEKGITEQLQWQGAAWERQNSAIEKLKKSNAAILADTRSAADAGRMLALEATGDERGAAEERLRQKYAALLAEHPHGPLAGFYSKSWQAESLIGADEFQKRQNAGAYSSVNAAVLTGGMIGRREAFYTGQIEINNNTDALRRVSDDLKRLADALEADTRSTLPAEGAIDAALQRYHAYEQARQNYPPSFVGPIIY